MNIEEVIRVGNIDTINIEAGTARVRFGDLDDMTAELQIISSRTQGDKVYFPYEVDEMVLCLMLPSQENVGFIIGAIYNDIDTPPATEGLKIEMKDGSFIEVVKGKLTINMASEIVINTPKLTINGDLEANNINAKTGISKAGAPYIHP